MRDTISNLPAFQDLSGIIKGVTVKLSNPLQVLKRKSKRKTKFLTLLVMKLNVLGKFPDFSGQKNEKKKKSSIV